MQKIENIKLSVLHRSIWKKKDENSADFSDLESVKTANTEQWICRKILRLHIEDVFDISWSADSTKLISASVDNTAVIWNAQTGIYNV